MTTKPKSMTIFFAVIDHPTDGTIRVGRAWRDRKALRSWMGFIKNAWHGLVPRIVKYVIETGDDGKPLARCVQELSEKWKIDLN